MNKYYLNNQFYILLLLLIFFTSCNGQVKTTLPTDGLAEINNINGGQPTLIRTQGTNEFAGVGTGVQDKAGNLWFGTGGEGVYRYDGKLFTNYTEKDGLSSNGVWCIYEDQAGKIWFGTGEGLCVYDPAMGSKVSFTKIPIVVTKDGQAYSYTTSKNYLNEDNSVWSIIQDKAGKFWFGTSNGIYNYDGKSFTHFTHNDGVINNTGREINKVESILEDKAGNIWFGGRLTAGLFRYDGKSLVNFKPDGENWARPVFEDRLGIIWFCSRSHPVYRYDGKSFTSFGEKELSDWVVCMAEDKAGNLWFAYDGALSKYDGMHFSKYTSRDGLSNDVVSSVTIDKDGQLWVGTRGVGLCSFDGKIFTDYSDKSSKDILRIFEDHSGNIWYGTNGDGVCKYDPSNVSKDGKTIKYFTEKDGFIGKDVRCITQDKMGNIWFGTEKGLTKYDGKNFTNFTVKDGLAANEIWSLLIDKTGTIWVGTLEGVCRYNPSGGSNSFISFPIPPAEENDFSRAVNGTKLVWDIKEDRAGNIWFATNGGGVYRYNDKSLINISQKDGLCNNFVNSILEDKKGNLWFATQHGGVSRYNPSKEPKIGSNSFTTFTEKEGLCSNEVWTMLEDKTGNIWFAGKNVWTYGKNCGLDRYDGKVFTNFSKKEGLNRNSIQSILEDSKGNLWLGCNGGLYRFDGKSFINLTKEWSLGLM